MTATFKKMDVDSFDIDFVFKAHEMLQKALASLQNVKLENNQQLDLAPMQHLLDHHSRFISDRDRRLLPLTADVNIKMAPSIVNLYFDGDVERFREKFCLNIDSFRRLTPFLFGEERRAGRKNEVELMAFLFWLAKGCNITAVSEVFDLPESSAGKLMDKLCKIIYGKMKLFVKFPSNQALPVISRGFCKLANNNCFKNTVGAINCCHVGIKTVPPEQAKSYRNKKRRFSSNFQALVDHEGRFINVFIAYPGSVHNSRILKNSPIFCKKSYPPKGYCILGDGSYPLLKQPIGILTPYKRTTVIPDEVRFNKLHMKAHSIVGRSFGRLKTRWRKIFSEEVDYDYMKVPYIIAACVAIQNFCLDCNDVTEPEELAIDRDLTVGQDENDIMFNDQARTEIAGQVYRSAATLPSHLSNDHTYSLYKF